MRDLGRLLQPADRLQCLGRLEGIQGKASVHEERGVRVARGDAVDADAFLDVIYFYVKMEDEVMLFDGYCYELGSYAPVMR